MNLSVSSTGWYSWLYWLFEFHKFALEKHDIILCVLLETLHLINHKGPLLYLCYFAFCSSVHSLSKAMDRWIWLKFRNPNEVGAKFCCPLQRTILSFPCHYLYLHFSSKTCFPFTLSYRAENTRHHAYHWEVSISILLIHKKEDKH